MNLLERIENDAFVKSIWDMKYSPTKDTPACVLFDYISTELSKVYPVEKLKKLIRENITQKKLSADFFNLMTEGKFLPGGRVIAGMGMRMISKEPRNITLQNCYGLAIEEDSIHGIFNFCERTATSYAWGGGVGTCISGLRPRNTPVNNASKTSTGSVSFLPLMDTTTATIGQNGRRGAFLAFQYISHPDILEFIHAKQKYSLNNMNISVGISDDFMHSVQNDLDWNLWYPEITKDNPVSAYEVDYIADCYKYSDKDYFFVKSDKTTRKKTVFQTIKAKKIWNEICQMAWEEGCPGILFVDQAVNNCPYEYTDYKFHTVNPCAEKILPANGVCNLGAINLSEYVNEDGIFLTDNFETDVKLAVLFLDSVLEYSIQNKLLPFEEQIKTATDLRIIGLGVTGVHDFLIKKNLVYGSPEGNNELKIIMSRFESLTETASELMGNVLGEYPYYDNGLADHKPRRNVQLRTIAPTGTISLLLGCSTGIEPVFALEYEKKVRTTNKQGEEVWVPEIIRHPLYEKLKNNPEFSKDIWIEASDLDYIDRINVQAICQTHIDSSISSTVNLPNNIKPEDISNIYSYAWESKCKGITIFRDGCLRQGILKKTNIEATLEEAKIIDREEVSILSGKTIKIPLKPSWYCTVNTIDIGVPVEVFINAGKSGSNIKAETEAYGRLISLYLQEGGSIERIIESLKGIQGREPVFKNGWVIQSHPDAIAKALEKILLSSNVQLADKEPEVCPQCGMNTFIAVAGCGNCVNEECLFTNCG